MRLILCKRQGRRDWQPLWTRWEQSYLLCVKVQVKEATFVLKRCHCFLATYSKNLESYWTDSNLGIFAKGNLLLSTSHPSTWGNQRGARRRYSLVASSKFMAPLPGTPLFKIGELHTIFYLCFLVLLVYFLFFAFESFMKNQKNSWYLLSLSFSAYWCYPHHGCGTTQIW